MPSIEHKKTLIQEEIIHDPRELDTVGKGTAIGWMVKM
jgi:hypothetical protein